MKKTSKFKSKKYPRLKKYLYGDTVDGGLTPMTVPEDPSLRPYSAPAESAAVTQQREQQAQLDANAKKEKNASNASNAATGVQVGSAILSGAAQAYQTSQTPGLSTYDKNQQYSKAIENTEQNVVGSISPGYGIIHKGVSAIMDPLTAEATKTDAEGNLVNRNNAEAESIGRAFADPMAMIPHMISTGFSTDKYADQIEESAKAKIAAQKAQEDAYAQQKASQQAQQQAYINEQIKSGISGYYKNPDKNQNQSQTFAKYGGQMPSQRFAMGGVPQIPNGELENDEFVTSQTAPVAYEGGGFKMASNNPAPGGVPTYESVGRTHSNGGIIAKLEDGGEAAPAHINGKTDDPRNKKNIFALAGKKFKDTMRNITNQERYNTKKLESGSKEAKSAANLMLPILAKAKIETNQLQKDVMDANQAIKDAKKYRDDIYKNGAVPSMNNDQTQNGMVMAKYGAQMKYRMGGMQRLPMYEVGGDEEIPKDYSNYADYAAAAAQLAGPITALIQNKKPALQNYVAPQASLLSSTESMRQQNIEGNAARKGLKDMTMGNVGQQLASLSSVSAKNALAKAQVQERYDNANAQIMNRNSEIAADYAFKSINKRDADLAGYEDINTKSIGDIGKGIANINRDAKQTRYDQDYMDFMEREYPQAYAKYKEDKKNKKKK